MVKKKYHTLHLHIAARDVEFLGPNLTGQGFRFVLENHSMNKLFLCTALLLLGGVSAGCCGGESICTRLFNRQQCNPCNPCSPCGNSCGNSCSPCGPTMAPSTGCCDGGMGVPAGVPTIVSPGPEGYSFVPKQ